MRFTGFVSFTVEHNNILQSLILDEKYHLSYHKQGEYIAPEKIELMYDRAALVGQCMIYGHSLKSNLVAIVVPDELAAASWAESKNISGTFEELCQRDDLKEEIMKQVCLHESFVLPSGKHGLRLG